MELGYILLAFDVVLAVALVLLARRGTPAPVVPRDTSAELRALEEARRAALAAADEAWRARAELDRALTRAERFTQQWAEAALAKPANDEPASERASQPAEQRIASALRALRRV